MATLPPSDLLTPFTRRSGPVGIAIDFETSGRGAHSACAVGLARIEEGKVGECFYSLIRPPSSHVLFTEVHGLTWPMLKDAEPFELVWPKAAALMRGVSFFVAHNASFDRRVLLASCRATGLPAPALPFLCTLKGARRSLPLPSRRLNCVCDYFGIALDHHNALSDARGCAQIYLRLQGLGLSDAMMRL